MTNATRTALVTILATNTDEHIPANRIAVEPAVFARLARESGHAAGIESIDELHITHGTEDADELDALDDLLRDRGQAVEMFEGKTCYALFPGDGIDGCDVWARVTVGEVADAPTMAELLA